MQDFQAFSRYSQEICVLSSVADPGCLSRIRILFHPGSESQIRVSKKHPGSATLVVSKTNRDILKNFFVKIL